MRLLKSYLSLELSKCSQCFKELDTVFKECLEAADGVIQWCKHIHARRYARQTVYLLCLTAFNTSNLSNKHATTICCLRFHGLCQKWLAFHTHPQKKGSCFLNYSSHHYHFSTASPLCSKAGYLQIHQIYTAWVLAYPTMQKGIKVLQLLKLIYKF